MLISNRRFAVAFEPSERGFTCLEVCIIESGPGETPSFSNHGVCREAYVDGNVLVVRMPTHDLQS